MPGQEWMEHHHPAFSPDLQRGLLCNREAPPFLLLLNPPLAKQDGGHRASYRIGLLFYTNFK